MKGCKWPEVLYIVFSIVVVNNRGFSLQPTAQSGKEQDIMESSIVLFVVISLIDKEFHSTRLCVQIKAAETYSSVRCHCLFH